MSKASGTTELQASGNRVSQLLVGQQVVPVAKVDDQQQAIGLANALLEGGVNVIEVTLRNAFGINAIEVIKAEFPTMVVLAGTVINEAQMDDVVSAGVDGVISPGISEGLLASAAKHDIPYLPGVATASEVMLATQHGLTECKLFPASVAGGLSALKAFSGPFPDMRFCPTGGVSESNYQAFLALPNVICVGGSWLAPSSLVANANWLEITRLCKVVTQST